jgi:hypothetical protein
MKKLFIISSVVGATMLYSCSQNKQKAENTQEDPIEHSCYQSVVGKDSAALTIHQINDKIEGELSFNFFEKDDSKGQIRGEFKGDTLFVDYDFSAEGVNSRNPLVFLKKDGKLHQGYGEIETYLGKTYFKDHSALKFENGFVFEAIDCPQ